jgi:hypothetical protein
MKRIPHHIFRLLNLDGFFLARLRSLNPFNRFANMERLPSYFKGDTGRAAEPAGIPRYRYETPIGDRLASGLLEGVEDDLQVVAQRVDLGVDV